MAWRPCLVLVGTSQEAEIDGPSHGLACEAVSASLEVPCGPCLRCRQAPEASVSGRRLALEEVKKDDRVDWAEVPGRSVRKGKDD